MVKSRTKSLTYQYFLDAVYPFHEDIQAMFADQDDVQLELCLQQIAGHIWDVKGFHFSRNKVSHKWPNVNQF